MKNRINPLGRAVLAAGVIAIFVGSTAAGFAQGYDRGHDGYAGDDHHDWHDNDHRRPPGYYYAPRYSYAPPPVIYAPPPPQYAPPVDLFFSFSFR